MLNQCPAKTDLFINFLNVIKCDPPWENSNKGDSTLTTRFHLTTKEFDFSTLKPCSESCLITESFVSQDTLKTIKREQPNKEAC